MARPERAAVVRKMFELSAAGYGINSIIRQLKADPRTEQLPVIVLTTTDDPREVRRCYELGCSSYVTKPVEYDRFVEAVRRLGLFLSIVQVPREDAQA